ncbi:MAG TPA: hypothetical protein VM658_01595 [bacterium]|nr:hypothetical protein [bacterium]
MGLMRDWGRVKADLAGFVVGLGSLGVQVVLIRRLMAAFTGNELTIGIALAAWMAWTGLGSMVTGRWSDRIEKPGNALAYGFFAAAVLIIPAVLASARIKQWLGVGPGEAASLPVIIASSFIITGPICAVFGFAFNLAARMQKDFRAAAGRAYRFEALGAVAAGAGLAAWFSGQASPTSPALLILVILCIASALIRELKHGGVWWKSRTSYLISVVFLYGTWGLMTVPRLSNYYQRAYWGKQEVLGSFDSRYGYLAAVRDGDQVTIFSDGTPAATFPDPAHDEALAHVALASCGEPWRVLLIGGSFTGMAGEVLKHGVDRVDYAQIDPGWVELEREFAPGFNKVYEDGRTTVMIGDGRALLVKGDALYDAIIVDLPDPFTAAQDRYYTAEFMMEARRALVPGGVLALTAGTTPPNKVYTAGQLGLLSGVMHTAGAVFRRVEVLPLDFNLVLAGDSLTPFAIEPAAIDAVLGERGVRSFYASSNLIGPDLAPPLLADIKARVAEAPAVIDRDLFPRGYFYGIMLWAERASPWARRVIAAAAKLPAWSLLLIPALVPALGLGLERRDRAAGEAALAAGVSGFAGVVVEVAVMIAYQVMAGAVYSALALLTASFMAGLGLGAWASEKARERAGLVTMEAVLAGWILLSILIVAEAGAAGMRGGAATMIFCGVLLGQGAAAGAVFAAAARQAVRREGELGRSVGLVYGTELLGSALGGLVTGAVLAPVFGIVLALGAALLAALALVMHSLFTRRHGELSAAQGRNQRVY